MAGGTLTLATGVQPEAPASGYMREFADSTALQMKAIDPNGVVSTLAQVIKPNLLANGGFDLAQRQTPATLTTYSDTSGRTYTADRWSITNENASVQYARVDIATSPETGVSARYQGRFKKITNAGKMVIAQVVEDTDSIACRSKTLRLQVRMKYAVASSMTVRIGLLYLTSAGTLDSLPATFVSAFGAAGVDPTWGTNLTALTPATVDNATISGAGATCVLTSIWARYGATFNVPATAKNLVAVVWTNGQPAANDELYLTEASLTIGAEIVDWAPDPVQVNLARCQRYYQKTFAVDTAPASAVGVNSGEFKFNATLAAAVAGRSPSYPFRVTMRTTPSVATYNPAAAGVEIRDETAAADCTVTTAVSGSDGSIAFTFTGNAGTTVGGLLGVHLAANAEL